MLTRRSAIKRMAAVSASVVAQTTATRWSHAKDPGTELLRARRKAAWRKRPLILDDDGDMVYAEPALGGPEAFLSLRMHDCRDGGIDSLAWCMMWGIAVKGKTPTRYWQNQMQGIDFQKNMPDPTPVIAGFCRQNNIEVFGSIRMTDFIRQARRRVDAISRQRVRPVLLGVRVPGTIETCNRIGLDIETWLRERLVDRLLTGGGYVCYSTPAEEPVALGHRHDVPVYPCINCPANFKPGEGNLRAAASNLWWAGSDGIYLWNFHYISAPGARGYGRPSPELYRKHLPEITDPRRLKYLDKSFAVNRRVWEQYQRASAPATARIR